MQFMRNPKCILKKSSFIPSKFLELKIDLSERKQVMEIISFFCRTGDLLKFYEIISIQISLKDLIWMNNFYDRWYGLFEYQHLSYLELRINIRELLKGKKLHMCYSSMLITKLYVSPFFWKFIILQIKSVGLDKIF